jgi:hypothetical protein
MLRLGLLAMVVFGLLLAIGGGFLVRALDSRDEPWSLALSLALWLSVLNGFLELARADLVVGSHRGAARALGRAFALPGRPRLLASALLLWALLGLLGAAHVAVGSVMVASVPASALLPAFLAQQAVAFLGAWLKLLRLATALNLAAAARPAAVDPR